MDASEKLQNIPMIGANFQSHEVQASFETHFYRDFLKRGCDLFFALFLLPFIVPVLLILMAWVKLDSKGPAIFESERIGKDGVKFKCFKLRTMCLGADKKLDDILENQAELKSEFNKFRKLKNDPRVTRVGRFLRSFSLDELPQLFNVLKGDMSFVGPRPAIEDEIPQYGHLFKDYKSLVPGITGMWQVSGRNNISFDERVKLDALYGKNLNILLDLKIVAKTLPVALKRSGAY